MARRGLHLAAADVPLAAARRRLRHRRLLRRQPRLRDDGRRPRVHHRGPPARHPGDRRSRHEPHVVGPRVVPARPRRARGVARARLVRVVRHAAALRGGADHLRRHRDLQLDVGRAGRRLLLASLLRPPARPELRQRRDARGDARRPALLAGRRAGRLPTGRRPLPLRARGHELREPRRDAHVPQGGPRDGRRRVPRPRPARRGQPVAGRRRGVLRRRRRMSHGLPLPGHAADVHGAAPRGGRADPRDPQPDAAHPAQLPVGPVPAQPRRADPRDGHRRGARLHVLRVRQGPPDEAQRRDPPPARPAAGQRPRRDRAAARDHVLPAGLAGPLLRRRDRHGRQRLPRRPRRRAHADAVDRRPQRRASRARTSRSSTRRR